MRENLSTDILYAQETGYTFVHLLTVTMYRNNGTTQIYRFCDQYVDLISRGNLFEKASFRLNLGSDNSENIPTVSLEFDSGDRQIIRELRKNDRSPDITLEVVIGETPDIVEIGPVEYQLESFDFKDSSVSMRLTVEPVLNEPIPSLKWTPTSAPGLFANIPA